MKTTSATSAQSATELPASHPAGPRNTGEGLESVLEELQRHRRVDDLVNHGPAYESPLVPDHSITAVA
jgi:hypothetical protein